MIQKMFLCKDYESAVNAVGQMADVVKSTPHRCALVTFYETGFSSAQIRSLIDLIKGCGCPDIKIAGVTLAVIADLLPQPTGIHMNLIITDEADVDVFSTTCSPGGEEDAAAKLKSFLDSKKHVRAVELFGSDMELNTTLFMEKAMEGHEDAVLFGTTTLRNLTKAISVEEDEQSMEVAQVDESDVREEFAFSDEIIPDGFVAIVFSGEKLNVKANYALGWKPIGRKFSVELGPKPVNGETSIVSINGMPAVDIYREYLGVHPDAYFVSNICEFPFMVERDGIDICLIPIDHGPGGELCFMMTVKPEESLRFSFASHDEVLVSSLESCNEMEEFGPQALFLTLCGNRINFLKEDAHLEWEGFAKVAPDRALMHGGCELYYYDGKGGILNSAHLSVGMREGDKDAGNRDYDHPTVESFRHGRTLSLSDRMSTFLGKITSELVDMANQAQSANNAKSAFLSHMSHEIRTPINAILGMDEMIIKESGDADIVEYADGIKSAGNNLLGIVNDILDFSKIEAGKMDIIPGEYELISLVKDMYNIVHLRAMDKGLTISIDVDPELPSALYGDSTRIKQIITNILTNAVKYTEEGSVLLSIKKISASEKNDEEEYARSCPGDNRPEKSVRMEILVKDTGIGIKPEDLERLFEEYSRFDENRNRSVEGTGLGMSITNQLLDMMGSRLKVSSEYGKGSEFSFEIIQGVSNEEPFGEIEGRLNKTVAQKKRIAFTASDAHILVVDDNDVNLSVVTKLLKNTKIKIDTAGSGEEALKLVQENAYDVILLDHMMPGMDGPETLKRMRELENNLSLDAPVISLTANALSNAKDDYLKAGYKDYLSKPFRPEELEDMLFYYIPSEKIRTVPW